MTAVGWGGERACLNNARQDYQPDLELRRVLGQHRRRRGDVDQLGGPTTLQLRRMARALRSQRAGLATAPGLECLPAQLLGFLFGGECDGGVCKRGGFAGGRRGAGARVESAQVARLHGRRPLSRGRRSRRRRRR